MKKSEREKLLGKITDPETRDGFYDLLAYCDRLEDALKKIADAESPGSWGDHFAKEARQALEESGE
jgi:hypothetical protein